MRKVFRQLWWLFLAFAWGYFVMWLLHGSIPDIYAFGAPIVFGLRLSALFSGIIANEKDYDADEWSNLGTFCGPFALIGACGLPDKRKHRLHGLLEDIKDISYEIRQEKALREQRSRS